MNRRTTVRLPDGRELPAIELGFQTGGEHWNEYMLDDGSVIKVKLVVTNVVLVQSVQCILRRSLKASAWQVIWEMSVVPARTLKLCGLMQNGIYY